MEKEQVTCDGCMLISPNRCPHDGGHLDCVLRNWQQLGVFTAGEGDVVLRRWKKRETGRMSYSLISHWKGDGDYLAGNEFLLIESAPETGIESMEYWSR